MYRYPFICQLTKYKAIYLINTYKHTFIHTDRGLDRYRYEHTHMFIYFDIIIHMCKSNEKAH